MIDNLRKYNAWIDYWTYGGMPVVQSLSSHEEKSQYLKDLFTRTYLRDVVERNSIQNNTEILEDLLNIIASSVGSLTNPTKIANTFDSEKHLKISSITIDKYLGYFVDAFLVSRAERYYIQSALSVAEPEKRNQEIQSLLKVPDSFRKIVVTGNRINPWKDENGILYIGIEQFLLDDNAINI